MEGGEKVEIPSAEGSLYSEGVPGGLQLCGGGIYLGRLDKPVQGRSFKPAGGAWLVPTLVPSRRSGSLCPRFLAVLSDFTSSVLSPQIHF